MMNHGERSLKEALFTHVRGAVLRLYAGGVAQLALAVPLIVWLCMFQFLATMVPPTYRPEIDVTTLPAVEHLFFGQAYLYTILPHSHVLILVASIPYLFHFVLPWLYAVYLLFSDARPFTFLYYLGVLNILAVGTQLLLPTAPPWYNVSYGLEPASYSMGGDPARFSVLDTMFEVGIFRGLYGQSPIVFGSFPSLHAGWPCLIAMYSSTHGLPAVKGKWLYMLWVWWAAIYSKHHFLVDLLGGAVYTVISLYVAERLLRLIAPAAWADQMLVHTPTQSAIPRLMKPRSEKMEV